MTELIRVTRGVWRHAEDMTSLAALCAAVLSVLPPGSVICGVTAARLHELWLPLRIDSELIEVALRAPIARARDHAGCVRPEVRARRRDVASADIVLVRGVPVTSEARTWVDLAERFSMPDLVAAGDSVLRGTTTQLGVAVAVDAARGRRGVRQARQALDLLDKRSRSRPESHVRYALVSAGLPKPAVNEAIHNDHGEWLAEPDLHYKRARLAIEYNGRDHAGVKRMRKDIDRAFDVGLDRWMTLVVGPNQAFRRTDQLVSLVTFHLDARDPTWRSRPRE